MAEKRVSVRLGATGGRQVRAELEGVGEAGARGFGRLSREMEAANARLAGFARRVAVAAAAAVAASMAAGVAMVRSGLQTVDVQAKLAQSLETTVASIQVLERAGELAGVSMGQVEQATVQLTRRLSQAAAGTGPAVEALQRLRLTAVELQRLPLDARLAAIQQALGQYVPEAERAAVASQLFGDRAALVFTRIDTATLRQATEDVLAFEVVVSEQDADQIERTNDAISRLGLIWRGLSNQLAVASAPALEAIADAMAAVANRTGPLGIAIRVLFENIGRLTTYAATFAAFLAGRWVAGLVAAADRDREGLGVPLQERRRARPLRQRRTGALGRAHREPRLRGGQAAGRRCHGPAAPVRAAADPGRDNGARRGGSGDLGPGGQGGRGAVPRGLGRHGLDRGLSRLAASQPNTARTLGDTSREGGFRHE